MGGPADQRGAQDAEHRVAADRGPATAEHPEVEGLLRSALVRHAAAVQPNRGGGSGDIDELTVRISRRNRSRHRRLVAGVVAALVLGALGGFLGGSAAAERGPAPSGGVPASALRGLNGAVPGAGHLHPGAGGVYGGTGSAGASGAVVAPCPSEVTAPSGATGNLSHMPLRSSGSPPPTVRLFVRTAPSGVTVRAYERSGAEPFLCSSGASSGGGVSSGGVSGSSGVAGSSGVTGSSSNAGSSTGRSGVTSPAVCTVAMGCGACRPGGAQSGGAPTGSPPPIYPTPAPVPGGASGYPYSGMVTVEMSNAAAVGEGVMSVYSWSSAGSAPRVLSVASGVFGATEGMPVAWAAVEVSGAVSSVRVRFADGAVDQMQPVDHVAVLVGRWSGAGSGANGLSPVNGTVQLLDTAGKVVGARSLAFTPQSGTPSGVSTGPVVVCPLQTVRPPLTSHPALPTGSIPGVRAGS